MKGVTAIEGLIFVCIVLSIGAAILSSVGSHGDFKTACSEVNGKVVWDGRQHQCIKTTKETHDND